MSDELASHDSNIPPPTPIQDVDPLSDIPMATALPASEIIAYSSSDEDGRGEVVGARVPVSWLAMIEELLEDSHYPLSKRSDFLRWCIWNGVVRSHEWIQQQAGFEENYQRDPMMRTHFFIERNLASIEARGAAVKRITTHINGLSQTIDILMVNHEKLEAADIINQYLAGVANLDEFYQRFSVQAMFQLRPLAKHIGVLIRGGFLRDEYLIEIALEFHAISSRPPEYVGEEPEA